MNYPSGQFFREELLLNHGLLNVSEICLHTGSTIQNNRRIYVKIFSKLTITNRRLVVTLRSN